MQGDAERMFQETLKLKDKNNKEIEELRREKEKIIEKRQRQSEKITQTVIKRKAVELATVKDLPTSVNNKHFRFSSD